MVTGTWHTFLRHGDSNITYHLQTWWQGHYIPSLDMVTATLPAIFRHNDSNIIYHLQTRWQWHHLPSLDTVTTRLPSCPRYWGCATRWDDSGRNNTVYLLFFNLEGSQKAASKSVKDKIILCRKMCRSLSKTKLFYAESHIQVCQRQNYLMDSQYMALLILFSSTCNTQRQVQIR